MPAYADRVKETTATTGTGAVTFAGAISGFQTFAAGFPQKPCRVPYTVESGAAWEVGVGSLNAAGTILTRDKLRSSSTGSFISLTGTSLVFVTLTAEAADNTNIGIAYASSRGMAMP